MLSRKLTLAMAAVCLLTWCPAVAQPAEAEKKAVDAATAWLVLCDAGKYGESWDTAAAYFKGAVTKESWVRLIEAARGPLGRVVSRTLGAKKHTTTLPGAPDGQYVVIEYKTVFEKKSQAVETVTPMLDKDGTWRVSGYYIR